MANGEDCMCSCSGCEDKAKDAEDAQKRLQDVLGGLQAVNVMLAAVIKTAKGE
jgi:hypothetical protein